MEQLCGRAAGGAAAGFYVDAGELEPVGVVAVTLTEAVAVEAHHVRGNVRGVGGAFCILAGGAVHKSVDADGPGRKETASSLSERVIRLVLFFLWIWTNID